MNPAASAIAELPLYAGIALKDIVPIDSAESAEQARLALLAADAIGFDTESKPTFRKGEKSQGPHLVQLATDDKVFLYRIGAAPLITGLRDVLESTQVLKVGFDLGSDTARLRAKLAIDTRQVLDLGSALRANGQKSTVGAKSAVARVFGMRLQKSKNTTTSNWANAQLTERQMLYAANDAHVALRLYREWMRRKNASPE
ncbi:MAG TPA: 3'-5' exonuclease [Usitatibacteraceae bacterium]